MGTYSHPKNRFKGFTLEAKFIFITILLTLALAALSSYLQAGWMSAFGLAIGMYLLIGGFAYYTSDQFLYRLLLFGIIAGLIELFADCWLVHSTQTLFYPLDEPTLACSPFYMPFAWAVVLIQVGYLGWLISGHKSIWVSILATAVLGLLFIPLFEHWANSAGWWVYRDTPMIFNTPYYIILAEGLICMTLPLFFKIQSHKNYWLAAIFGVMEGFWIWASYVIAYAILG
ncbi:MAG: hypothetical protein R3275_13765 [Saprospiraceae bacterium]|nr:hypothetical protein [Saprospiraceae bacterium]